MILSLLMATAKSQSKKVLFIYNFGFSKEGTEGSCLKGHALAQHVYNIHIHIYIYTCLQLIPSHSEEAETGPWMKHSLFASFDGLPLSQCYSLSMANKLARLWVRCYFHFPPHPTPNLIRIVCFDKWFTVPFSLSTQITSTANILDRQRPLGNILFIYLYAPFSLQPNMMPCTPFPA